MTPRQAMDFVRYHGVVLESAKGLEPSLAERVVGGEIRGGWWSHPRGNEIHELTTKIRNSAPVLVCTLARGRITYVHRRLWTFFIRLSRRFPPTALDMVREVHSDSGRHKRQDIPFPQWVPEHVRDAAKALSRQEATNEIRTWLERYGDVR